MVTISQAVRDILERKVFYREAISRNIVSYNLLASTIKQDVEVELGKAAKHSAIVMALRRQSDDIKKLNKKPSFHYSISTIKTDLFYVVVEHSTNLLSKLHNFCSIVDFKKGGILNIIQGNFELAIITNIKYKEDVLDLLCEEKVLETIDDLVSLSLSFSKEFLLTPGTLYDILRFVAWENINIIDIILTQTELSLIINKKDLMRCYQTLSRFVESANNNKD